mmetsp:Transcript_26869/g.57145  ORF Transcript_26869/g.57145 Transcript_26869/m.57145 type:complete len:206 (+) Transcript_26869:147-764(+)|eukprot:CAMPEP_0172529376 /NCGR_PEP_ID=MMETSP1067-20121228/3475_1 /TAXON_ID=265564 ORGANISM="Thalassiosira punctigera, Strain Tpunct2005C2" /NCGR_SAMPLE_ID=MMETSP1067 /ASSEMBLY_ACC=CAM_ASM_000444 /LENGTH=205 /DNA_ID=CAMNT_0013313417 /DNA_START=146 /DNA_END=763 /DNA_ORIENTATION=-
MANNQPSDATSSTLVTPRLVRLEKSGNDDLECSLHLLPKPLMREFGHVFNDEYLKFGDSAGDAVMSDDVNDSSTLRLLAIPTNQRAREDLVAVGDHIEQEKDRLLNVFIAFGKHFCEQLRAKGFWADYIDPCSGLPMISLNCNKVYSEVDGMECLLNYKAYNAGFCKILTHPKWGSAVYPATIFAHAPAEVVRSMIESLPAGATA